MAACQDAMAAEKLAISQYQEQLAFVGGRLHLRLTLTEDNTARPGQFIYVDTDNGTLSARTLITDSEGTATVEIESPAAGKGTVKAHTRRGASAHFEFDLPAPDGTKLLITSSRNAVRPGQSTDLTVRMIPNPIEGLEPARPGITLAKRIRDRWGQRGPVSLRLGEDNTTSMPLTAGDDEDQILVAVGVFAEDDLVDDPLEILDAVLVEVIPSRAISLSYLGASSGVEIETGVDHSVEVLVTAGELRLHGWAVDISLDRGTPSKRRAVTDGAGIARFSISSVAPGSATLTVGTDGVDESLDLKFVAPARERNEYRATYGIDGAARPLPLDIPNDDVSFVSAAPAGSKEVYEVVRKSGLKLGRIIGDDIIVLKIPRSVSRETQWRLARELLWRNPGTVLAVGLPARLSRSSQRLLIDQTIIARFKAPWLNPHQIHKLLSRLPYRFSEVSRFPYWSNVFALRLDPDAGGDTIAAANAIAGLGRTTFAQPNFLWDVDTRTGCTSQGSACDPDFRKQWHHDNPGYSPALRDADIDTPGAWKYTEGERAEGTATTIAVVDSGFDASHPDLLANLATPADIDDATAAFCFQQDLSGPGGASGHGTNAAGVAAARGGNVHGGKGVCPRCKLLLYRYRHDEEEMNPEMFPDPLTHATAIGRAADCGADVISNSWGFFGHDQPLINAVDDAVANKNVVVHMAVSNEDEDNCKPDAELSDTSAQEALIAVGGVTDNDTRNIEGYSARGYGDCMDILAPTRGVGLQRGLHTTDVGGAYNPDFGGTSAATPVVAGVAALMRAANPGMKPLDVQRALQDTADKVAPGAGQPHALYDPETGFDDPPGAEPKSLHAWGRVNAFEAVRLVAKNRDGKNGRDLFLRDHELDWGNTEQPSNTLFTCCPRTEAALQSVDIRVDAEPAGPHEDEVSLAKFEGVESEALRSGKNNRIFVRVRNRGPEPVKNAVLKLFWAPYVNELPRFPANLHTLAPGQQAANSAWKLLDSKTMNDIAYSGASVAGCPRRVVPECLPTADPPTDEARVFVFDSQDMEWNTNRQRVALIAVLHSTADPVLSSRKVLPAGFDRQDPMHNVLRDNNVTLWTSPPAEPSPSLWWAAALALLLVVSIYWYTRQNRRSNR